MKCPDCGAPVAIARIDDEGKSVILDLRPAVFHLMGEIGKDTVGVQRDNLARADHKALCFKK